METNVSAAYLNRLSSSIPEIPDIPSPLLRPPTVRQTAPELSANCNLPSSSASVTSSSRGR